MRISRTSLNGTSPIPRKRTVKPSAPNTTLSTGASTNVVAAATTLVYAPVDSVVLGKDGFTVDVAGVGEVPFSQVHEIGN